MQPAMLFLRSVFFYPSHWSYTALVDLFVTLLHGKKWNILILKQHFLKSTQGGEITVKGLTETAWQVSSVRLHVEKRRHDYRIKHPQGIQDLKQHE